MINLEFDDLNRKCIYFLDINHKSCKLISQSNYLYISNIFEENVVKLEIALEKFFDFYELNYNIQLKIDVYSALADLSSLYSSLPSYILPYKKQLEDEIHNLKIYFDFQTDLDNLTRDSNKIKMS